MQVTLSWLDLSYSTLVFMAVAQEAVMKVATRMKRSMINLYSKQDRRKEAQTFSQKHSKMSNMLQFEIISQFNN